MAKVYSLNPVTYITVETIGRPGERVFYLQAGRDNQFVTLIIEKQHAVALAASLDDLLSELHLRFPKSAARSTGRTNLGLRQPVEPLFRVGQIGLGYDESADMVVLIAYQLALEENDEVDVARFWATREQMQQLRNQALSSVEGGRPVCGLCGELVDPEGHLCTRRNGHGNHPKFIT